MDNQKSKERSQRLPVSAENVVTWGQSFHFTFKPSSELEVRLKEVHIYGNRTIAVNTVKISELWNAQEITLPILGDERGTVCTLRMTVEAERDAGRAQMKEVVVEVASASLQSHTGDLLSTIEIPVTVGVAAVSSLGDWGPLLDKIKIGADIVQRIAEMNVYTKIAWGLISAGYELAKKQKERDENVAKLIEALNTSYDVVNAMDGLNDPNGVQVRNVTALIKYTITCGTFIKSYLEKGFLKRAVNSTLSSTDDKISEFSARFKKLQDDLGTFASIATQRRVEDVLSDTGRILSNMERIARAAERSGEVSSLTYMPLTPHARWRSGKKCLAGTRTELISRILNWAHLSDDKAPRVLLLTGVAGVGKSSIVNTIASHFQEMSCLAASYCFDRNNVREHRPDLLMPTIAHQLAHTYPAYRHVLASMNGPDALATPDLDDQFENLLRAPLNEQSFAGPLFVVVDALDESANRRDRAKLLKILAERFMELPWQVRLVVTSRPEEDIRKTFSSPEHVKTISLDAIDSSEDIETFVESKLVADNNELLGVFTKQDCSVLASKAEGLFQWAAVVCTSITQSDNPNLPLDPEEMHHKYAQFMSLRSGALDELYNETLARLFPNVSTDDALFTRSLGLIVASQQPLSATAIFDLLQIDEGKRRSCFIKIQSLGALLTGVSNQDEPIRTLHSSFRDYLFQIGRDQRFYIDRSAIHGETALGCLRVLNEKLKFNICGLETSYVANEDVPGLAEKISKHVLPLLSYAAHFWGYHIQHTNTSAFGFDDDLGVLLREKFLFWLELLSLTGAINVASPALSASDQHIATEELKDLTTDYRRFVRVFGQAISRAAPHVYLSAYAFAPTAALVHQQPYSEHMRNLPRLCGISDSWSHLDISIEGHTDTVTSVAFSPNGRHIVSGSYDETVRIWDAETGTAVGHPLKGHTGAIYSVNYSPDGRRIVSGAWDSTVRIWDAETGDAVGVPLEGHTNEVTSVAYSPDGQHIASGSRDCTVRVWDAETSAAIGAPLEGHTHHVSCVAYSPDGLHIVSGSHDATIRIWDAKTGVGFGAPLEGHKIGVHSVAYAPDSLRIVSGSGDWTVRIWDVKMGTAACAPLEGHTGRVYTVAYSPDGHHVVSGATDRTVRIWDAETGAAIGAPLEGHTLYVSAVAYSPDGKSIVSGSSDHTIRVWDAQAHSTDNSHATGHTNEIYSVAYSPNGRRIVSGSQDETLRIWDTETGALIGAPLKGHTDMVASVAYSPDGRRIVSGSYDNTVRIWDAESGDAVGAPLEGHEGSVESVAYSPNGLRIISGSDDQTIRIWNAETGAVIGAPLKGHRDKVSSVGYSRDGKYIASNSWDSTVRIWDAETGTAVGSPSEGHTEWVHSVAYSPDRRFIVSGIDVTVRIWDAETGAAIGVPLEGHAKRITTVIYSPDGKHIASGSRDGTVRIWDVEPVDWEVQMCMFSPEEKHALQDYPRVQSPHSSEQVDLPSPFFCLADSGWIEDISCSPPKLLLWIPAEYRHAFYLPPTSRIISSFPSYSLDLSDFVHGVRWTECYQDGEE